MTTSSRSANVIIRRNTWQSVWRLVTGDALLAAAVLIVAALLGLTAILPQTPHADAPAYSRWLSGVQGRFGGASNVMIALGLFDIARSVVFRAAVAMLCAILLIRFIGLGPAFQAAARLNPPPSAAANTLDVGQSPAQIVDRLKRYRIRRADGYALADRYPWGYRASIAAHAGPLIILLGLAASPLTDWHVDGVSVDPGSTATIRDTPYALEYAANSGDGGIQLKLIRDGEVLGQSRVARNSPWLRGDASVYVRDSLPALTVRGTQAGGKILTLQSSANQPGFPELLLKYGPDRFDGFFAAPGAQIAVRASWIEQRQPAVYRVTVFSVSRAQVITETVVAANTVVEAGGARFEFIQDNYYVLTVAHTPAQLAIAAAAILTAMALLIASLVPTHHVWLLPIPTGTRIVCDDRDFDLAQRFSRDTGS